MQELGWYRELFRPLLGWNFFYLIGKSLNALLNKHSGNLKISYKSRKEEESDEGNVAENQRRGDGKNSEL